MADVFVSYARSDRARVAPVVAAIEAAGWSVWWDPAIDPGQEFDEKISAELAAARAVLVVWTPISVKSRWVRGEARAGADRGILVPVRFDAAELPIDVRAFHTTDLDRFDTERDNAAIQHLLSAIQSVAARSKAMERPSAATQPGPETATAGHRRVAICVLPFANMSGDPEQEYFSDGISEDIITDLSKVSAMRVMARSSSFVYKGRHVDIVRVGREIGVSHVLEGSVRKAGDRVRITAQLVDAATNDHLWAERYDRRLDDIFKLQDEITQAIVQALRVQLLPAEKRAIERRGTENTEAYNCYLMARQFYVSGSYGDVHRAGEVIRLASRATEIDPNYAQAWALVALGKVHRHYVLGGDDGMADAERALTIDPSMAVVHAIRAAILADSVRHDEASAEIAEALRLDPESYEVNRTAGYVSFRQRRMGDAIRYFEKAITLVDTDVNSANMLQGCYSAVGNRSAQRRMAEYVLSHCEAMLAENSNDAHALSYGMTALCTLGQAVRAKEWMARALLLAPDDLKLRYNFACSLADALHDTEGALELLEHVFRRVARGVVNHAKIDPDLDSLRDNPRFQAMMAAAEARLVDT
jgi:adenylate cyclase